MRTSAIKRDTPVKRLKNGIFVKSNTKRFTEFKNCNLSQISRAYLTFLTMLKSMSFPLTVPNRTSYLEKDFSLQSPEFYSCIQFEIEKDWPADFANCETASLTVFTTMCPEEQQTSDNPIVKDYCFIIEIFDKGPVKLMQRIPKNSFRKKNSDNPVVKDYCFIIEIFDEGPVKLMQRI